MKPCAGSYQLRQATQNTVQAPMGDHRMQALALRRCYLGRMPQPYISTIPPHHVYHERSYLCTPTIIPAHSLWTCVLIACINLFHCLHTAVQVARLQWTAMAYRPKMMAKYAVK
jgi:hypothetical protein